MKPGCSELITSRSRSFRGIQVAPAFDYSFILSHNFGCRYIAMGFCDVLEKKFSFEFSLIMERISFQTYGLEFWISTIFTTCWISIKKTFPDTNKPRLQLMQKYDKSPSSNLVFSIFLLPHTVHTERDKCWKLTDMAHNKKLDKDTWFWTDMSGIHFGLK